MNLPVSKYTRNQVKVFRKPGIAVTVRFDDHMKNGSNTFFIMGATYNNGVLVSLGCIHDEIAAAFPELTPLVKWHLTATNGPLHYVANSVYWAGGTKWEKANLKSFRASAVWPEATEQDMALEGLEGRLLARLPTLMAAFKRDVESLGFAY